MGVSRPALGLVNQGILSRIVKEEKSEEYRGFEKSADR